MGVGQFDDVRRLTARASPRASLARPASNARGDAHAVKQRSLASLGRNQNVLNRDDAARMVLGEFSHSLQTKEQRQHDELCI